MESLLEQDQGSKNPWGTFADEVVEDTKSRKNSFSQINAFAESNEDDEMSSKSSIASPGRKSSDDHFLGHGVMLHTFMADASNPEELSIFDGDSVSILEFCGEGWVLVQDPSGRKGLVPKSYVDIQQMRDQKGIMKEHRTNQDPWTDFVSRQDTAVESPKGGGEQLLNVFSTRKPTGGVQEGEPWGPSPSFSPKEEADATSPNRSFTRQGSITGTNPFTIHRRQASSHNRNLSGSENAPSPRSPTNSQECTVIADFVGEMEGEITVRKGEVVRVISEIGGWSKVIRLSDKQSGLAPSWAVSQT